MRVNWRHPLAPGLIFAVLFNDPNRGADLTDPSVVFLNNNNVAYSAGLFGTGWTGTGNANQHVEFGNLTKFQFTEATSWTHFSLFQRVGGDGTSRMFPSTKDSGVGARTLAQWRLDTTNVLAMVFGNAGATLGIGLGATAITDEAPHTGAGVRDVAADQIRVFLDGAKDSETTDASTGAWTVANGIVGSGLINATGTASFTSFMRHYVEYVWTRALSDGEIALLHQDPYGLLEWDSDFGTLEQWAEEVPLIPVSAAFVLPFEGLHTPLTASLVIPTACGRAMTYVSTASLLPDEPTSLALSGTQGTPATVASPSKPSICGRAMTGSPPLGFGFEIEVADPPEPDPIPFPHVASAIWQGTTYSVLDGGPFVDGLLVTPQSGAQSPDYADATGYWIFLGSAFLDELPSAYTLWGGASPLSVEIRNFDGAPPDGAYTEPFYHA